MSGRPAPAPSTAAAPDGLDALAARVRPVTPAHQEVLPVLPALASLAPGGGLRRGSTVAVDARGDAGGATSLALAVAAGPSRAGSWVAVVGLPALGLVAAAEMGVALDRLALVGEPERSQGAAGWAAVVAALVDGFDVVVVGPGGGGRRRRPADARRLVARVRERGAVLLTVGGDLPERSHLHLSVAESRWHGLGDHGSGHLAGRRVTVVAGGRGEASRPRRAEMWLPTPTGEVAVAESVTPPVRLVMTPGEEPDAPPGSGPGPSGPVAPPGPAGTVGRGTGQVGA